MTDYYIPVTGDRIRFTADGTVTSTHHQRLELLFDDARVTNMMDRGVGTLEKLIEPLPTTSGTVIRWRGGLLHLSRDGVTWVDDNGLLWTAEHILSNNSYEVVSIPPAGKT